MNFVAPRLTSDYQRMADNEASPAQWALLSDVATIGPDSRSVRGAFDRRALPTESGWRALWYHKTDITQSMFAKTDTYVEPKPNKKASAAKVWATRSRFFLSYKLWLPLARVSAVTLPERALSSIWIPCSAADVRTEDALCLYLNSSLGLLAVLGGRDNRKPSYPQFSLDTLRSIPVPNFPALGDDVRDALAGAYERLKDETLLPFPQMNEDPIRRRLDDVVTEAFGLDAEWVSQVRRALGEEPSITNRRYAGSGG